MLTDFLGFLAAILAFCGLGWGLKKWLEGGETNR